MTTYNPNDLNELEQILLGVLGAGLVPSNVAGDASFRLDYLCAVSLALIRAEPRETYLDPDGRKATPALQHDLTDALADLEQKRILSSGGSELLLTPDQPPSPAPHQQLANFDQHPKIFDRYLAGRCLDALLRNTAVYRFIMDKYADSSEVYQKNYQQYR